MEYLGLVGFCFKLLDVVRLVFVRISRLVRLFIWRFGFIDSEVLDVDSVVDD